MPTETPPKIQVLQSTTPAITKRSLAAAQAAKEQAKMQQEMMKQLMMMFQPGMQPNAQGSGSIGGMMGPMVSAPGAMNGQPVEGMQNQNQPQDNMQQAPKAPPKQRTA